MKKVMPTSESWSAICRKRIEIYKNQIENENSLATIEWVWHNLSNSYRPTIFKIRCAKMLRRAINSGRIKENGNKV